MEIIQNWFEKNKTFGIMTPEGWFGRPYDNMHKLTWLVDRKFKCIIETDEQMLFIITKSADLSIKIDEKDLVIKGYTNLVFDRLTYGDMIPETKTFQEGELRFVSYSSM